MPATWSQNTITNQALTMMNQALGVSAITFTKAVMITDDITKDTVSQLQALTSVNYKQTRVPRVISTEDAKSRVGVTIDNQDVNEDYTYYGVGLYAKQNTTNQEILFSVVPLTAAATMVANENNVATSSIYLDLYTDIVRGTQITIMVSNSGALTREDVEQLITKGNFITQDDLSKLDYATKQDVDTAIKAIPQPDTSTWQKQKITADDGSPKLVIASGDDVNDKLGGKIGTTDAGTVSIDIGAKNNSAGHTVFGMYQSSAAAVNATVQFNDGTTWSIAGAKGSNALTWRRLASSDDLTIVYAGVPNLSFDDSGKYTITASKNADIAHITDYTLYYRVKGTGDFTKVALTPDKLTGTIDLSKVTTATNYEAYATATNVFGESDPSPMVEWSYDPDKASSTPPTLAIDDKGIYTITAPTSTPTAIVKYYLYYNVDGKTDVTKLDVGTSLTGDLTKLITKPDKTTTYDVQATAMNANAESGVSNSVQFTYVPIDDNIYGASWDRKSIPTLTRTDAAVGLKAGINGAQNDFDNVGPWKGMHRITDSMGNVFVRVPKFYIRKTQTGRPDNGTATWQVSLASHGDDWYLPKGFWDFENSKELDYIDIGAYDATGSSSKLTSFAGQSPLVNLSIADFRKAAQANGTDYQIWDIHAWDMLQVLFIIEFATLNSQSIMEGIDGGSGAANSGSADNHKGSSGTAGSGSESMSYRGIENLYGNIWQFCDGVNFQNNQPWVCENATNYQSNLFASPYVRTSYAATSDNGSSYIKALGLDNAHPYAQFTIDDSGSDSDYYADYDYPGSGNTTLETGGYWGSGTGAGLFYSFRHYSSDGAGARDGCRLLRKALP